MGNAEKGIRQPQAAAGGVRQRRNEQEQERHEKVQEQQREQEEEYEEEEDEDKKKEKLICSQKHHLFDTFSGTEKMKKKCGKKWLINVYYKLRDVRNIVSARTEPNMINTNNITLALSLWHFRCAKLYNNRRTQGSTQGWTQGSVRAHSQLNILVFAGGCIKLLEVLEPR